MADLAPKKNVKAMSIGEVHKPGVSSHKTNKSLADELNRLRIEYGDDMVQLAAVGQVGDGLHPQAGDLAGQDQFPVRMFARKSCCFFVSVFNTNLLL